nr:MAG: hypothetical protein [Caudoviricetes sp.]
MSKFEKNMEEFFEVPSSENLPAIKDSSEIIPHETLDIDFKKDYEFARDNFHDLIEKGKDAVDDILAIAKESEKGRDFEVAATLLSTIVNANKEMIELHKKVREITNYKQETTEKTTINNALFVGSTTELSKLVKELNQKELKDIN